MPRLLDHVLGQVFKNEGVWPQLLPTHPLYRKTSEPGCWAERNK